MITKRMVYISHMHRTQIYLPKSLYQSIDLIAKREKKSKAEIIRTMLEATVEKKLGQETLGDAFDKLIQIGEKLNLNGPKDLSTNHDAYLYKE